MHSHAPYLHFPIKGKNNFQIKNCTNVSSRFGGLYMFFAVIEKDILCI